MKLIFHIIFLTLFVSCTSHIDDYAATEPKLRLFDFFEGKTQATGMVQDFTGKQIRRFKVDIIGTITNQQELRLEEIFLYDDGEIEERTWLIKRDKEGRYTGKADDVVGQATGEEQGNALNWSYTLRVKTKEGEIDLKMDDWMYRQNDRQMFNLVTMKKFGIEVGRISLFFEKLD